MLTSLDLLNSIELCWLIFSVVVISVYQVIGCQDRFHRPGMTCRCQCGVATDRSTTSDIRQVKTVLFRRVTV